MLVGLGRRQHDEAHSVGERCRHHPLFDVMSAQTCCHRQYCCLGQGWWEQRPSFEFASWVDFALADSIGVAQLVPSFVHVLAFQSGLATCVGGSRVLRPGIMIAVLPVCDRVFWHLV